MFKTITCALCGKSFPVPECISAGKSGSPDLDTRPAEPARPQLKHQVTCCYSCAYCSDDIEQLEPELKPVVLSKEYLDTFSAVGYSAQASYFRCKALLDTKRQHYNDAFWATMHAAWTCDDQGDAREARFCRLDALRLFKVAKHAGQEIHGDEENESLLFIDILRRVERFEDAEREIKALRKSCKDAKILRVLDYQDLILRYRDAQKHSMDDVDYYFDHRNMYLFHFDEDMYKAVVKEKRIRHRDCPDDLHEGDIVLLRNACDIASYAIVEGMAIIDVGWPSSLKLYGRVFTLKHIKRINPPLQLDFILPGEAGTRYLYFDKCIRVEREDQKMIEKVLDI